MITREQVLEYFRIDEMEELDVSDRYEIMLACCSQSDFLEQRIRQVIDDETRLQNNEQGNNKKREGRVDFTREEALEFMADLLKAFDYEGHEKLMNTPTGSVDTAENWAAEAYTWSDCEDEIYEQFEELIEVKKDKNGDWIEKE